ncbi:MAG: phosphoribosylamine--glycine ligase [Acidimicrobiia bacterium]|nr:phosphoribosylamine--glycine ligase [Acidimicrobiia bacterium]
MRALVVGSGGREHALCLGLAGAGHEVLAAPGNPGMAEVATLVPTSLDPRGLADIVAHATAAAVDLVVVGPEAPLVQGFVDRARAAGLAAFGPEAAAARLEGSKAYAKEVMERASVPTARAVTVRDLDAGLAALREVGERCVVKADGLAAGKGVVVAESPGEAERAVRDCFGGRFGDAGTVVVIEELLEGEELSVLVLCDGQGFVALPPAQDHKPIGEGDTGPNTGGMGAYSPVPAADPALVDRVLDEVVEPTIWGLRKDGVEYTGVLYCGLMLTGDGPKVLEFNCRFGDPEAQAVLPRLQGDIGEVLLAAAHGHLDPSLVTVSADAAVTVVAAAEGYPDTPRKGDPIEGLDDAAAVPGAVVFQAGTKLTDTGLVTDGGRVLAVTGLGQSLRAARDVAYTALDRIEWRGKYVRRDIGYRALVADSEASEAPAGSGTA